MEEVTIIEEGALQVQEKAMYDVQIATAKKYPRDMRKAIDNAIVTVTMDQQTAESCNYSLPRGGKPITGPSVHLAKILAQFWGNMRAEARVVSIDNTTVTSQAVAFDLENNLAIKVEVKRSIMTKNGRMNTDMQTVTGNAANAIALRNAIFNVIPKAVVDKVYGAAQDKITGDISDDKKFAAKRDKVFAGFNETYKVTEDQLLKLIGKTSIDQVTKENLVTLIGVAQAIKDGDTTVEETFKPKAQRKDEASERVSDFIAKANSLDELEMLKDQLTPETELAWQAKWKKLGGK